MIKLLPFLFLFLSVKASADILFLDLNNAPLEIAAARRAAAARGERLIVIPADGETLRGDNLAEELAELKNQNVRLTSMVISGHDGNGAFSGTRGNLSEEEVRGALQANPPMADTIRSLLLWGCYTATPASIELVWKQAFPNLVAVAGFDGSAPLSDKPGSSTYLEDFLKIEERLTKMTDINALNSAFLTLRNVPLMTSAACVNGVFLKPGQRPRTMNQIMGECSERLARARREAGDVSSLEGRYSCYFEAAEGCEDPPANKQSSDLRSYYNEIQNTAHCSEAFEASDLHLPSPDQVIRLIYFRNVVDNFVFNYQIDIDRLNGFLDQLGAPSELKIGDLRGMTRAQIRQKYDDINNFLNGIKKPATSNMSEVDIEFQALVKLAQIHVQTHSNTLRHMEGVPFSWVEPNSTQKIEGMEILKKITVEDYKGGIYRRSADMRATELRSQAFSESLEGRRLLELEERLMSIERDSEGRIDLIQEIEAAAENIPETNWAAAENMIRREMENIPRDIPAERRRIIVESYNRYISLLKMRDIP